jgi:hypothetical protein
MDGKSLFPISLGLTLLLVIWTLFLPYWDSEAWFISRPVHNAWVAFDIILVIFFIVFTYMASVRAKALNFLSPLLLGMIAADWILNIGLWIYAGYDLLSPRFLISLAFVGLTMTFFAWFFSHSYRISLKWHRQ